MSEATQHDLAPRAQHDTAPRTVLVGRRTVAYRRFGEGPPVVLLHASPRSSASVLPLGLRLASRFTVFAFDSPGFGWSDPLPFERPDAEDYATALIEAFDSLGLGCVPIYGSHTGAAIAVAAGVLYPQRVACVALDGYSCFTAAEQAEYLASYLAPITPHWDGTHLAWLWGRVKDQFTAFPWYWRAQSARMQRSMPPPAALQAVVVDFLAAGDFYRHGYAAAFRFDHLTGLRRIRVPAAAMARSDDQLFGHLDRLSELPDCVSIRRLGTDDAAWAAAMSDALAVGASGEAPDIVPSAAAGKTVIDGVPGGTTVIDGVPGGTTVMDHVPGSTMVIHRVPGGTIGLLSQPGPGGAAARPVVLLPPIPGAARAQVGLARALSLARPVITPDLPGFGASALVGPLDAASIARALHAAVGAGPFDIVAIGESAAIGCALAALTPDACLVLVDPVPDEARSAVRDRMVDVTPRPDGSHLLAAWHQLRDTRLWRPWFEATPAHAIDAGQDPDVGPMQATLTDWMRGGGAGKATLEAAMACPLAGALPPRSALVAAADHPWTRALANLKLPLHPATPDRRDRATAILRALSQ